MSVRWAFCVVLLGCHSEAPKAPRQAPPARSACATPTAEIEALVARLDADADELHADVTPSVLALGDLGIPGACAVVELLQSPSAETRLHAERVMERAMARRSGFKPGRGYPDELAEANDRKALETIGYAYDANERTRHDGAMRWHAWLEVEPPPSSDLQAVRRALDAARARLEGCGLPLDLSLTIDGSGQIASWYSHGETRRGDRAYQTCVDQSIAAIRGTPSARSSTWVRYPW